MKLRLRENSIRLRLLQSEIKMLHDDGFVSEKIRFATQQTLTYTIRASEIIQEIAAQFENEEITIEVPKLLADEWTQTECVGLEGEQKIDGNLSLKILLEKDFVCLDHQPTVITATLFRIRR